MKQQLLATLIVFCTCEGHAYSQAPGGPDCISGDCQNGYGVKMQGEKKVEGIFKDGTLNDKHFKVTYPTGAVYDGDWGYFGMVFDGEGTYTSAEGAVYTGHWKKGYRNGPGTQRRPDGTIEFSGTWKDDQPIPGSETAAPSSAPVADPPANTGEVTAPSPAPVPDPPANTSSVTTPPDNGTGLLQSAENSIIDKPSGDAGAATKPQMTAAKMYFLIEQTLEEEIKKGNKWADAQAANKSPVLHDDISLCRFSLERLIDQDLYALRTATDVGGSKEFREAAIDYLKFDLEFSTQVLSRFENVSAYTTDEERRKLVATYTDYLKQRKKKVEQLDVLADAYVAKNKIDAGAPQK